MPSGARPCADVVTSWGWAGLGWAIQQRIQRYTPVPTVAATQRGSLRGARDRVPVARPPVVRVRQGLVAVSVRPFMGPGHRRQARLRGWPRPVTRECALFEYSGSEPGGSFGYRLGPTRTVIEVIALREAFRSITPLWVLSAARAPNCTQGRRNLH